jgi:hypothetical protein
LAITGRAPAAAHGRWGVQAGGRQSPIRFRRACLAGSKQNLGNVWPLNGFLHLRKGVGVFIYKRKQRELTEYWSAIAFQLNNNKESLLGWINKFKFILFCFEVQRQVGKACVRQPFP